MICIEAYVRACVSTYVRTCVRATVQMPDAFLFVGAAHGADCVRLLAARRPKHRRPLYAPRERTPTLLQRRIDAHMHHGIVIRYLALLSPTRH